MDFRPAARTKAGPHRPRGAFSSLRKDSLATNGRRAAPRRARSGASRIEQGAEPGIHSPEWRRGRRGSPRAGVHRRAAERHRRHNGHFRRFPPRCPPREIRAKEAIRYEGVVDISQAVEGQVSQAVAYRVAHQQGSGEHGGGHGHAHQHGQMNSPEEGSGFDASPLPATQGCVRNRAAISGLCVTPIRIVSSRACRSKIRSPISSARARSRLPVRLIAQEGAPAC